MSDQLSLFQQASQSEWPVFEAIQPLNIQSDQKTLGTLAEARKDLIEDRKRYEDILARGVAAMSKFDVDCVYQGDGESAVKQALVLKRNHIAWNKGVIQKLSSSQARS